MKKNRIWLLALIGLIIISLALGGSALAQEPPKPNGLIALLTDYGEKDFYVGAVKGVIYSAFPGAQVVDITHQVTPFDIHEGAVTLWLAARTFPPGTVFVAVVDPGVGTERRAIALETSNGLFFVAPDNGLLTLVMQEFEVREIREITNQEWMRHPVSYTFHGRDIFAPVGAQLAKGRPLAEVGPIITDPIWLPIEAARVEEGRVVGQVLMIDQYGNVQANITGQMLAQIGLSVGDAVSVQVGGVVEASQFLRTYGDVPEGEDLIFIASTDLIEIAINMGNASEKFGAQVGSPVVIEKGSALLQPRILATPTVIVSPVVVGTPVVSPTPGGEAAAGPVVTIMSPASGTQVGMGQEVLVQSVAIDPQGVVKSELLVDGQLYRSVSSPSPQGQPSFPVTHTWRPGALGNYRLTVRAYNVAGSSGESPPLTIQAVESLALTPTGQPPSPSPEACTLDATFVADVTISDYTTIQPGGSFDKIWRLRNSGTCSWEAGYRLSFVSGEQMGAPASQAVTSTPPGGTADISVPMYAPAGPGTYEGRWRMVDPNNAPFGQTVRVIIQVAAPLTATPTSTSTPTATSPAPPPPPPGPVSISFRADDDQINAGECTILRWDVENVREVYLDGEGVAGHGSKQVCPGTTTTYTLHVVKLDGSSEDRQLTVIVTGVLPAPPSADLALTHLFAENLPQGRVYVRITNIGPDSLTNASVEMKCSMDRNPWEAGQPPSAEARRGMITVRLNPGQTGQFDTGFSVDTTQYWYEIECDIEAQTFNDPNINNDSYSEIIPPPR